MKKSNVIPSDSEGSGQIPPPQGGTERSRCARNDTGNLLQVFICVLLLSACSNLPAPPPDQYFRLITPPAAAVSVNAARIQVETVEAHGIYAERPLLFRENGKAGATQQYRYDLWSEPPAKILRDTLVEHLRAQYGAERVWTSEARAPADFVVRGRLRALEQLLESGGVRALLSLEFVVTDAEGNVVAVSESSEEIPAASPTTADFVAALNQGLARAYTTFDQRLAQVIATRK